MKHTLRNGMHFALMEIELLVLLAIVAYAVLLQFKPTGIMTSAEGDVLRYRFAENQDDLLSRCQLVRIEFATKQFPVMFSNPKLNARDAITPKNCYAWHEIKAPVGTIAFRFDVHWKKDAIPSRTGPEVEEIWLGKRRIDWSEMKATREIYEPLTAPCYKFQPHDFFNLNGLDLLKVFFVCFAVVNGLLLAWWFIKGRRAP